jgi:hypothetical protein
MFVVNFEDGSSTSSRRTTWLDLPKDKKIKSVQLSHPRYPNLYVLLKGHDKFYFMKEAVARHGEQGVVVAEIVGGHDSSLGIGIEIRVELSGNVIVKHYDKNQFRYAAEILREGTGDPSGREVQARNASGREVQPIGLSN